MAKKEKVKKNTTKKTTVKKVEKVKKDKTIENIVTQPIEINESVVSKETEINHSGLEEFDKTLPIIDNPKEENETPQVEVISETKVEDETENNNERTTKKIDNIFGYFWNGQEMEY